MNDISSKKAGTQIENEQKPKQQATQFMTNPSKTDLSKLNPLAQVIDEKANKLYIRGKKKIFFVNLNEL